MKPVPDRIEYVHENDWNFPGFVSKGDRHGCGMSEYRVGLQFDQLFCECVDSIRISSTPAGFNPEIAAFRPSQLHERSTERC